MKTKTRIRSNSNPPISIPQPQAGNAAEKSVLLILSHEETGEVFDRVEISAACFAAIQSASKSARTTVPQFIRSCIQNYIEGTLGTTAGLLDPEETAQDSMTWLGGYLIWHEILRAANDESEICSINKQVSPERQALSIDQWIARFENRKGFWALRFSSPAKFWCNRELRGELNFSDASMSWNNALRWFHHGDVPRLEDSHSLALKTGEPTLAHVHIKAQPHNFSPVRIVSRVEKCPSCGPVIVMAILFFAP